MKVELASEVESQLRKILRNTGRHETGGMLFGEQLAPGHFRIIDLSVDNCVGSISHFLRDPQIHQEALNRFFDRTGQDFVRFNYLGEWHSHPTFSVAPSAEDVTTMTELVNTGNSAITFAVLLVVRLRLRFWLDYSLNVFARGLTPTALRLSPRLF